MSATLPPTPRPPVPRTLGEYLRSFGPGIVVVLTWLGAGDVVDMAVAGSSHEYSLMWVLVVAVLMRFVFVSAIARYQLCNPHGEGVLELVWTLPGMPSFVTLTLVANSAQVVLLPLLAIGHFRITSSAAFVGTEYRNRPHENVVMALLVVLALYGAFGSPRTMLGPLMR